jgi:hypothetical protein
MSMINQKQPAADQAGLRFLAFGEAPHASSLGYFIKEVVCGTQEEIAGTYSGDVIAVQGPAFQDRLGAFEWAIMTKKDQVPAQKTKTVYCIARESDSVTGVDWFSDRQQRALAEDLDGDVCFNLDVPYDASVDEITRIADDAAWNKLYTKGGNCRKAAKYVCGGFALVNENYAGDIKGLIGFYTTQEEAVRCMQVATITCSLSVVPAVVKYAKNGNIQIWNSLGQPIAKRRLIRVTTEGPLDDLVVTGSDVSDEHLKFLLDSNIEIEVLNQDSIPLKLSFDMDGQSLVAMPAGAATH